MPALSILIPARKEPYLTHTIEDIFRSSEADTEVWVGMDGCYQPEVYPLKEKYPSLQIHTLMEKGVGQRAMTRRLAERATGRYLMKTDAHCAFGPGFDRILLETIEDDMILSPLMYPLNAEKWTVHHHKPMSNFYFDRDFVMQFAPERPEPLHETMCLQGSCFVLSKDLYFNLNLDEEAFGSWGSQGVELGLKAWLNGYRCLTTKRTYYAHLFRETDKDFPYDRGPEPGKLANAYCKETFGAHPKLPWLIEKFGTPGDWGVSSDDGVRSEELQGEKPAPPPARLA